MLEQFLIKLKSLIPDPETGLLLAVSGGIDSMVLLEMFGRSSYRFEVAHCNFQLRGADSEGDENLVRGVCEKLKVPFHTMRFQTAQYAANTGQSIQMAARELRYAWFDELLKQQTLQFLVTAHHADDHTETILMNLVRGTGIEGLRGIQTLRGNRLRPMLEFDKDQILLYARAGEIKWREDSSNTKDEYRRNFLRHRVVPLLKEQNPSLNDGMRRFGLRMEILAEYFEKQFEEFKHRHIQAGRGGFSIEKKVFFDRENRAMVYRFLEEAGFGSDVIEQLFSKEQFSGKLLKNSVVRLLIDRDKVYLNFVKPREEFHAVIEANEGQIHLPGEGLLQWELTANFPDPQLLKNPAHAFLDVAHIKGELAVRNWKTGDKMRPFGMKGRKLVSDLLIDGKITLFEKEEQLVITSGDDIIWLVNRRVSGDFAISDKTEQMLHFSVS